MSGTPPNGIKLIYGAGGLSSTFVGLPDGEEFHNFTGQILDILEKEGITTLDTAEIYPGSEAEIGYHDATKRFVVDTKSPGAFGGDGRLKDEIVAGVQASLEKLKTKQVEILYIHSPDVRVPWEEQLAAINELYKQGAFRLFGVSNFTAEQVQEVYDISKKNGYPLPSVYQGNYSAVARIGEELLFPTLRKLGIKFYAYSPIAGGFLAKTRDQVEGGHGRFDSSTMLGQLYGALYNKSALLDGLDIWNKISTDFNISRAELAYRWIAHHSVLSKDHNDGIIFGAHKLEQIKQTIGYLRAGPLPADAVKQIEGLWDIIKDAAPIDNFHSVGR